MHARARTHTHTHTHTLSLRAQMIHSHIFYSDLQHISKPLDNVQFGHWHDAHSEVGRKNKKKTTPWDREIPLTDLLFLSQSFVNVTTVQYVRAYFEYLRGNSRKAHKILLSVPATGNPFPGQSVPLMLNNNIACILLQMRKPNTGAHHLRLAWRENEKAMKEVKSTAKGESLRSPWGRWHRFCVNQ